MHQLRPRGTRVLHEYDGATHRERERHAADLKRDRRLSRAGWTRHGYVKDDVLHGAVQILADADDAVGREHLPARIRPWHQLLRASLFTPAGTAAFRERLRL